MVQKEKRKKIVFSVRILCDHKPTLERRIQSWQPLERQKYKNNKNKRQAATFQMSGKIFKQNKL